MSTQTTKQEVAAQSPAARREVPKLITSKKMILHVNTQMFLRGSDTFFGPSYHIQIDPSIHPKQTPCRPIPVHLKEAFQQEINKVLQAGLLAPVNEATP